MKYNLSDPLFTLSVASQLVKLHPRTLMLYEKAELLKPFRTPKGHRRYSQADIERIKFVHYLTKNKRVNLAGIKLVLEVIRAVKKYNPKIIFLLFPDFQP